MPPILNPDDPYDPYTVLKCGLLLISEVKGFTCFNIVSATLQWHNNLVVNMLTTLHLSFQRSVHLKAVSTMVLALHLNIFMRAQVDGSCVLVRVDILVGDVKTVIYVCHFSLK